MAESTAGGPHGAPAPELSAWVLEAVRNLGALASTSWPGGSFGVRLRVHVSATVIDRCGGPLGRWVQDGRRRFVGAPPAGDLTDALDAFAERSALASRPVDATVLAARAGDRLSGAARAVVAASRLAGASERAAWSAVDRAAGRRPRDPAALSADVAVALAGLPALSAALAVGAASHLAGAVAPPVPPVEMVDGAASDLVAHVLAEAVGDLLAHAVVRTALLVSPVPFVVAVRLHGSAATVAIGQGRVTVSDGVRDDALAVLDGPLDSLVDVAVASVTRQLGGDGSAAEER